MIDLHCHILPDMDDGPESLDEAIDMCRTAAKDGVKCIVATPHFKPGTYEFTGPRVAEVVNALMAAVQNSGLDIHILPGAEVTVSPEMSANLKVGGHLTLNYGRYFLAEFSPIAVPAGWDTFLLSFLNAGLTPNSVDFRPPKLSEAVCLAADVVGRLKAEALVTANPMAIIEGRPIPAMEPVQYIPSVKAHNRSWFKRLKDFSFAGTS